MYTFQRRLNVNDEKVKHKGKDKGHPVTCLRRHRGETEI